MSRLTTQLFLALAERGLNFADLSKATGYSVGTLYNLASGSYRSKTARRKVEAFLGVDVWPTVALGDLSRTTLPPPAAIPEACSQAATTLPPQSEPEPATHTAGPALVSE